MQQHGRHTAMHHGRTKTAHEPDAEARPNESLEIINVFNQRESGTYGESADGRVDHKRHSGRCNQKNPESGLVVGLPLIFGVVFYFSERSLHRWLGGKLDQANSTRISRRSP
jgi:hypothetical protein